MKRLSLDLQVPPALQQARDDFQRRLKELTLEHHLRIEAELEMFLISGAMSRDLCLIKQLPRPTSMRDLLQDGDRHWWRPTFPTWRIA